MLYYLLVSVYVLVCLLLIVVILLQQGKGGDIASAFGGDGVRRRWRARGRDSADQGDGRPRGRVHRAVVDAVGLGSTRRDSVVGGVGAPAAATPAPAAPANPTATTPAPAAQPAAPAATPANKTP